MSNDKKKGNASNYEKRGVSSGKEEVHAAIATLNKGVFPGAFCNVFPDLTGDSAYCSLMHNDGAGTKAILAYLAWKEGFGIDVWRGIAQDSFVMNLDDMVAAGATGPFAITMSIDRNKHLIDGEVLSVLIDETKRLCEWFTGLGISCVYCGGETADVGDSVRTITVNHTFFTRMKRSDIIDASKIAAPAYIVGFSSTGKMAWEKKENSGMGSNGLTDARHDVLSSYYADKYPEAYAPETPKELVYCGKHLLSDPLPKTAGRFTIASALLSPTQSYAPLLIEILKGIKRSSILGIIHCSGGGQTKIGKYGAPENVYIKDALLPIPPLFRFLRETRKLEWKDALKNYNMGSRMEMAVKTKEIAGLCISIAQACGIEAKIIGEVRKRSHPDEPRVIIKNGTETLEYSM